VSSLRPQNPVLPGQWCGYPAAGDAG